MRVNWAEELGPREIVSVFISHSTCCGRTLRSNGALMAMYWRWTTNPRPQSSSRRIANMFCHFDDDTDFHDADRGFIAALSPCVIKAADGRVVWDNDAYSFLDGPAPTSVHPSLWRQSTLAAKQGLYEVVPGIYQVRGFDISNVTFVEGDTGIIVIDPLVSTEVAAAALALYRTHRGGDRARRRGDLHPQPCRPLRRRAGRHVTGGRGRRRGRRAGTGRLRRACGAGERLRRARR